MPGPVYWIDPDNCFTRQEHPTDIEVQLRNCHTETGECLCVCGSCKGSGEEYVFSPGKGTERYRPCPDCATRQRCMACIERERDELVEALRYTCCHPANCDENYRCYRCAALAKVGK